MDNDFLNAYISRMVTLNNELQNKNIMLEAKLSVVEQKYNQLLEQQAKVDEGEQGQQESQF